MKVISFALVLCTWFGGSASAECEAPHALVSSVQQVLTKETTDVRYSAYLAACTKAGGDLVDSESATYQGRIGKAILAEAPRVDRYPRYLLRRGISGVVIAVGVIEVTGKITDVTLIGSSGHGELDYVALNEIRHFEYRQPVTLDGVPVRALRTFVFRYLAK